MKRIVAGMAVVFLFAVVMTGDAFELPLEAEGFKLDSGWQVSDYGYFPAQPNLWSLNKIISDTTDNPAFAVKEVEIPESKTYNVWARFESCWGFGGLFKIKIVQNGKTKLDAEFNKKEDLKYFPFGRGYVVQGPWYWHNTDYVYQGTSADLEKGKAEIIIYKDKNEYPPAKRVVDFVYITDDTELKPGNDWNWRGKTEAPIISRFKMPFYIKARVEEGEGVPNVHVNFYLIGYYKGPQDDYYFSKDGISTMPTGIKGADKILKKDDEVAWQRIDVSTVLPPIIRFSQKGSAKVTFEVAVGSTDNVVKKIIIDSDAKPVEAVFAIGKEKYEKGLLGNAKALLLEEIFQKQIDEVSSHKAEGRKVQKLRLGGSIGYPCLDLGIQLAIACGMNSEHYGAHLEIYGLNPKYTGFDTSVRFITLQNQHMSKECYEGDFSALEVQWKKYADKLHAELGYDVPYNIKLIEEAGVPGIDVLMSWPKVKEEFEKYLKAQGIGSIEDAKRIPYVWHYHSYWFRSYKYAKLNAEATKLIEKIFPKGTTANSGSFYPSTGSFPTLDRGDLPYMLFRERGVNAYSSEVSWGLGGTPDYISPQSQSYEGAIGRALSKYYNIPMGTYLLADGNRGYTGDFVELASYAVLSQNFTDLHYYSFGYPAECCFLGYPDILKAIKNVSYNMGVVDDYLASAKVKPAKIAVGWSTSTDIWDIEIPDESRFDAGNCMYPQERHYVYLILKHLQHPVDVLFEEDLTEGYLKNYKVFFFIGDHIKPESASALKEWVANGGTLISVAGGGFFDHYNQPMDLLKEVYGIKNSVLKKETKTLRPKLELLHVKPIDSIKFASGDGSSLKMDVYGYKQTFEVGAGKVIGAYENGEPAVVENNFGKGRAVIIGALPGVAYMKPGIPAYPYGRGGEDELSQYFPTVFQDDIRYTFADIMKNVKNSVTCSNSLVEPTILENKTHYVVPLINYTYSKLTNLEVTLNISELGKIKSVKGSYSTIREKERDDNTIVVEIPTLDKLEVLILERE